MRRYELEDIQWEQIADLFPSSEGKSGGQWHDHRGVVNGMLWGLCSGAPWRDLPERYDKWKIPAEKSNGAAASRKNASEAVITRHNTNCQKQKKEQCLFVLVYAQRKGNHSSNGIGMYSARNSYALPTVVEPF